MDFKMLLYILLMGVFVNNYVLQKFLGICPFLGVSKKAGQAAGMGVAMGNAEPEVKKIANYVCETNDEDGVAKTIEQMILSKA